MADDEPSPGPRVTLLTRAGCHLCEAARAMVEEVCGPDVGTDFALVDVDTDPGLVRRYGDEVPVVLVDGAQIGYWRIPAVALREALGLVAPRRGGVFRRRRGAVGGPRHDS